MRRRQYADYAAYLEHQREKTRNPKLRAKLEARWQADLLRFRRRFDSLTEIVPSGAKTICLGARTGVEVEAARESGFDAIGIDLVPCPPLVVAGDFHQIPFPDASFALAFCNSVDHVFDLDRFAAELSRVLTRPGWFLAVLAIRTFGRYEACKIDAPEELTGALKGFRLLRQTSNGKPGRSERIELLLTIDP